MADLSKFESDPRTQLIEELKSARCVMLGSPNPDEHMQPMSPQIDDDTVAAVKAGDETAIYFFSDNTSDLGRAVIAGPGAMIEAVHIDKDYQASIKGRIEVVERDVGLIDRFWNPIVASWYPGGKDDPKMLMLRFTPEVASIWASTGNPIKFLYETAKANIKDTQPDVGGHKVIAA